MDESTSPIPAPPPMPQRIGRYQIVERIGEGAASFVYRGVDAGHQRTAAIKILHPTTNENTVHRFLREARVMAGLSHRNLVPVYEVGSQDGQHYLVMEYIQGETLERFFDQGRLGLLDRIGLMLQVCEGVAYAHRHRIIHRDLKPSNIMIEEGGRAVVTDFGLARAIESETKVTRTGTVMGTPGYMSPEQVRGLEAEPESDVFSLGAILYEAVTGHLAFGGKTEAEVYDRILNADPIPPRQHNVSLHLDLETIILKAIDKDPLRRYESAVDLAEDLRRFLAHEPIRARKASIVHRTVRYLRRQKRIVVPFMAALLVALCLGALWLYERTQKQTELDRQVGDLLAQAESTVEKDPEKAEELFVRAQALDPRSRQAVAGIEKARRIRQEKNDRIRSRLVQIGEWIHQYDLARVLPPHDLKEDISKTLEPALRAADDLLPLAPDARWHRGRVLWRLGRFDEAEKLLTESLPGREAAGSLELAQMHMAHLEQKLAEDFYAHGFPQASTNRGLAQKAIGAFQRAVAQGSLEPHDIDYAVAQMQALEGKSEEALKLTRALIDRVRDKGPLVHARALGLLAQIAFDQRRYEECLKALRSLKDLQRSNVWVYIRLAQTLFHVGYLRLQTGEEIEALIEQGLADLDLAQMVEPGQGVACNMAGILLWFRGHSRVARGEPATATLDEAQKSFEKAIQWKSDYRVSRINLGSVDLERARSLLDSGRDPTPLCEKAIRDLELLIEESERQSVPRVLRGMAYEILGRHRERRGQDPRECYGRSLDEYEKVEPSAAVWLNRAVVNLAQAEYEHAHNLDPEESLKRVDEDCGKAPDELTGALVNRGVANMIRAERALQRGKNPAEFSNPAIEDFSKALARNPKSAHALANRAVCHGLVSTYKMRQGQDPSRELDASIADCEAAIGIAPSFTAAHANLGVAYLTRGQFGIGRGESRLEDLDRGIRHTRRAIELDSANISMYVNLTSLCLLKSRARRAEPDRGRPELLEAERAAGDGIRRADRYFQIYYTRGEVYFDLALLGGEDQKKYTEAALRDLTECLRLYPSFGQAHLVRGQVHLRLTGDFKSAVADLERAVQINPQTRRIADPLIREAKERRQKNPEY